MILVNFFFVNQKILNSKLVTFSYNLSMLLYFIDTRFFIRCHYNQLKTIKNL